MRAPEKRLFPVRCLKSISLAIEWEMSFPGDSPRLQICRPRGGPVGDIPGDFPGNAFSGRRIPREFHWQSAPGGFPWSLDAHPDHFPGNSTHAHPSSRGIHRRVPRWHPGRFPGGFPDFLRRFSGISWATAAAPEQKLAPLVGKWSFRPFRVCEVYLFSHASGLHPYL